MVHKGNGKKLKSSSGAFCEITYKTYETFYKAEHNPRPILINSFFFIFGSKVYRISHNARTCHATAVY